MSLPENRKKFEELIKNWIMLEENTITTASDLMGQSDNPMVKTMIDLVKLDSEKHKRILETIRLSLNSAVTFTTDDLKIVDSFIEKHAAMEKNAVSTAEQALAMGSLPLPKLLLSHLLEDEKSHDSYMEELTKMSGKNFKIKK